MALQVYQEVVDYQHEYKKSQGSKKQAYTNRGSYGGALGTRGESLCV